MQLGEKRFQVSVSYGQYDLAGPGCGSPEASTGGTGLIGAQGEVAFVVCGTNRGWIELAECPRCDHRWTRQLAEAPAHAPVRMTAVAVPEVANAA